MKENKEPQVKVIQSTCTEQEYDIIKRAAEATKRSMAGYLLFYGLEAAKQIEK